MSFIIVILVLIILYLFSLRGRTGHPGLKALQGYSYAHRGLHNAQRPENSLAAFQAAVDHGFGMELDVHLLKDGTLAVIHDSLLQRTTGAAGRVEDLTRDALSQYFLQGTDQTIPTLPQVLEVVQGKVPLIVELKSVDNNYALLTQTACQLLDSYHGVYCMESFDPRCIRWLKRNRPEIVRGQLSDNHIRNTKNAPWLLRFVMTGLFTNFLTLPDFVAYNFTYRKQPGNFLARKLWKLQGVTWTLRTPEDYRTAVEEGYIPIFENFIP